MSAPKGNQFWKLCNKHGRSRLWSEPSELWEAACEYFQWVDDNPWIEAKPVMVSKGGNLGSDPDLQDVPRKMPYTLKELCLYLGCSESYFRTFRSTIEYSKLNTEEAKAFLAVIAQIESVVFTQQFKGATGGFFNANIISRALGLIDKKDVTSDGEKLPSTATFKVEIVPPPSED